MISCHWQLTSFLARDAEVDSSIYSIPEDGTGTSEAASVDIEMEGASSAHEIMPATFTVAL